MAFYRSSHDNIVLMVDFNTTPNNRKLNELTEDHELRNFISKHVIYF